MSERIDHAAEAVRVLRNFPHDEILDDHTALAWAQVHATLALVEQRRIANIIAVTDGGTTAGPNLIAHVKKALGLT